MRLRLNSARAPRNNPHVSSSRHFSTLLFLGAVALASALFVTRVIGITYAYANEGCVTISRQDGTSASYRAYPLFFADVSAEDRVTRIEWSNARTRTAVLAYLDETGYASWLSERHPSEGQHDLPQNAAEYCSACIDPNVGPIEGTAQRFSNGLARALMMDAECPYETAEAGQPFTGAQGYWLFVTESSGGRVDTAGTLPIWVVLGGSTTAVTEKSAIPTAELKIREDATMAWGRTADAHARQPMDLQLTGTLPSNLAFHDQYRYRLITHFEPGLDLVLPDKQNLADAVTVSIDGKAVPIDGHNLAVTYEDQELVVDFENILSPVWEAWNINPASVVTVDFCAHLTGNTESDDPIRSCHARLEYTGDPLTGNLASTHESSVRAFFYTIELLKRDESGKPLEGASFTIQVAHDNSDVPSQGKYVQGDGTLSTDPFEFTSDRHGTIRVPGIDEGSFKIIETKAPDGFSGLQSPITLKLSSVLDSEQLSVKELTATVSSPAAVVDAIDTDSRTITLSITNTPIPPSPTGKVTPSQAAASSSRERLPQTGVGPMAEALCAAGLVTLVVTLVRARQRGR